MECDKDLRDKIIETARDVRHICKRLEEGGDTFKEHKGIFRAHAKRIRDLESNQKLLTGKMTLLIMALGATMLFLANLIRGLIFK